MQAGHQGGGFQTHCNLDVPKSYDQSVNIMSSAVGSHPQVLEDKQVSGGVAQRAVLKAGSQLSLCLSVVPETHPGSFSVEVVLFTDVVFIGYFTINDTESLQMPAGLGPSPRKACSLLSYMICLSLSVSYYSRGSCVSGQYLALVCG